MKRREFVIKVNLRREDEDNDWMAAIIEFFGEEDVLPVKPERRIPGERDRNGKILFEGGLDFPPQFIIRNEKD